MSSGKVYKAVYSGVQVYEMMIHGIATMVRADDSYLNATQILKVAGFEKTRRSKILEREVLTGEHEKVQGGYGKYQGTWIPFDKGKELAEKYDVLDRMLPLLNFDPTTIKDDNELPTKEEVILKAKMEERNHATTSPKQITAASPTPQKRANMSSKTTQARKKLKTQGVQPEPYHLEDAFYEYHRSLLMNIFLSDDPEDTPTLFSSAILTKDINIDLVIDEQGHTALHWAAALGRKRIVELLIENGANVCRVNYEGETPLMRAAMIACCYETKCFGELVDRMSESISVVDNKGRTVLHHIALTAAVDGYTDAAIYYMKRFVKCVPKKYILKAIINIKDTQYYESALAIALRIECQDIVDILIKQGALDSMLTIEDNEEVAYEPKEYESSVKGKDFLNYMQTMIEKLEDDYKEQLKKRDLETFELKKEINMTRYELREAQRRLELPVSMQLAEARKKIQTLEEKLKQKDLPSVDDPPESSNAEESAKDRKLDKKVKTLQNQVEASNKMVEKLQMELEQEKERAQEKEMEYRRLIATSCGLPIEKVDALVKPLTLVIESDPPDLDMTRVIGFMERLRRQQSVSTPNSMATPTNTSNNNVNSPLDPTPSTPI